MSEYTAPTLGQDWELTCSYTAPTLADEWSMCSSDIFLIFLGNIALTAAYLGTVPVSVYAGSAQVFGE